MLLSRWSVGDDLACFMLQSIATQALSACADVGTVEMQKASPSSRGSLVVLEARGAVNAGTDTSLKLVIDVFIRML